MFHGVLAMLSPAFFLLSGSLYLLSSLTAPSVAVPAPAPVPAAEAIARASIWSDDNLRRSGGEDEDRRLRQKEQRHGQLGAVASESRLCSGIGTDMLTRGGNAADAIVATVFCVGTTGMYHSGMGGGGFMLVRAPNGTHEFIDFRETAPAAAFEDMYKNNTDGSIFGGLASGVPGEARGLEYLHSNYGVLPWSTVMEPAIRTARYGWPVNEDLASKFESGVEDAGRDFLTQDPTWAIDFAPNGTLLGLGDIITRRRYADTLEEVSLRGADAFYTGPIANATINALQAANGTMTMEDLRNYTVAIRPTEEIEYRGYKIASSTAPTSGPIGLSILKILNEYDHFFAPEQLDLSTHRMDEAMRFAYGQRTKFGDPLFVDDMAEFQQDILSDKVVAEIRSKISDSHTQNVSAYDPTGLESLDTPGTSHISSTDASGLSISLTTTVNLLFGSTLMVPETGVIMNNEMNDFSIPGSSNSFGYIPSPANFIRPGKRPLSSICPIIVTDENGAVYLVTGAAGGSRIITSTVQSVINVVDRGMTAPDALAEPRMHDQLVPARTTFEWTFDNSTVDSMRDRGHNVTWVAPGESTVEAIRVLDATGGEKAGGKVFEPAAEPRLVNSGGSAI